LGRSLPNLALVGCGAIAQGFYCPALLTHRARFDKVWLVDPSDEALNRAQAILPGNRAKHLSEVDGDLDLVIVATPNQTHFVVAKQAIERGAHVLIEKPFVLSPEEGRNLMATATAAHRTIAINQTRRYYDLVEELRSRISAREFGELVSVEHREGTRLDWPFQSGSAFLPGAYRTGVIMDFGVHVIDLYHYLLEPTWSVVSCSHDGFRGPEGLAHIELRCHDAPISIRLSRYYQQTNRARLAFERGVVEFGVYNAREYAVRIGARIFRSFAGSPSGSRFTIPERVLLNLLAVWEGKAEPVCDAKSSLPVIAVLDELYRRSRLFASELGAV